MIYLDLQKVQVLIMTYDVREVRSDPTQISLLAPRVGVLVSVNTTVQAANVGSGAGQRYMITGEFRLHWPDGVPDDQLEDVIQQVVVKLQDRVDEVRARQGRHGSRGRRKKG